MTKVKQLIDQQSSETDRATLTRSFIEHSVDFDADVFFACEYTTAKGSDFDPATTNLEDMIGLWILYADSGIYHVTKDGGYLFSFALDGAGFSMYSPSSQFNIADFKWVDDRTVHQQGSR
jgi:hypothetical protein